MLAAGDSTRLDLIFYTQAYRGNIIKRPRITTDEPDNPIHYVQISTYVTSAPDSTYPVVVEPYKLNFLQTNQIEMSELTFEINNVADEPLDFVLVDYPEDYLSVDFDGHIESGGRADGIVTLRGSAKSESFSKSLTFEIQNDSHDRFTIPISQTVLTSK